MSEAGAADELIPKIEALGELVVVTTVDDDEETFKSSTVFGI